jgi:putative acetyltransferase
MIIRPEHPHDIAAIAAVTAAAFARVAHSDQSEPALIVRLRAAGALHLSLVAEASAGIVGHIAFSRVLIDGQDLGWFGLGPVSVLPDVQGQGIGGKLIRDGLSRLAAEGAAGCVLLGNPAYYQRFGFRNHEGLRYPGPPSVYFQALALAGHVPEAIVTYHPAFF